MNPSALVFKNVGFTRGGFSLNVNTSFPAEKLTVILGPSGSGKTTLLDLAAGFLIPDSGTILEGNRDVTRLPADKRRVGVVFQDHALFPHLSVRNNVAYGPRVRGMGRKQALKTADRYLEMARISRYADKMPSSLSGGEKQRVALARALAIEPELLLLDEPFSSLDASLRRRLRGEVRTIQKETGITAVLVTHDQEEALSVADVLAVMRDGEIVQMGKPADLWKNPADLFTAGFIGRSTRLKIRKIRAAAGKPHSILAETAAGTVPLRTPDEIPDGPSTLIIRPEDLFPASEGVIHGKVKEVEYSGEMWKIHLSVADSPGDVLEYNSTAAHVPSIGELVSLNCRDGSGRILPGQSDSRAELAVRA